MNSAHKFWCNNSGFTILFFFPFLTLMTKSAFTIYCVQYFPIACFDVANKICHCFIQYDALYGMKIITLFYNN